jgi:hypothetical protein
MYVGPYPDEAPTIAQLHKFATDSGYQLRGKHHETDLSDPRRTAPEKLRTATRQPIGARPDYSPAVRKQQSYCAVQPPSTTST